MERPEVGEIFTAEIGWISNSGNGMIETEQGHPINIGPVTKDSVGAEITAVMVCGTLARCKTDVVMPDDYVAEFEELKSMMDFCAMCGATMHEEEDSRVCPRCGYKESKGSSGSEESQVSQDISPVETNENQMSNRSDNGSETSPSMAVAADINDLRERAMEHAVEEVPKDPTTTTQTTSEYTRSQAVVEYVKTRADGVCEGCGEPAPFTSKTGDPYLHAHHVHELSDGGSDTPDTVIALCPNCHYRVHHGKDGEEYNQKLLNKVQSIED